MMKTVNKKILIAVCAVAVVLFIGGMVMLSASSEAVVEPRKPESVVEEAHLPPLAEMAKERTIGAGDKSLYIVSSFTCSHCANFNKNIFPILKKEYVDTGRIKVVFADFPLDPQAFAATMLSRCVPESHYLGFVDTLFEEQMKWAYSNNLQRSLLSYARLAGLSPVDAKACMEDKDLLSAIGKRRTELNQTYSIDSTPSFILMKGSKFKIIKDLRSYEQLVKAINEF